MQLGGTQREIFDRILNVISPNMAQAVNGSNQIYTTINVIKVTIRFFIEDGTIISLDAFVGWTPRLLGNLIN